MNTKNKLAIFAIAASVGAGALAFDNSSSASKDAFVQEQAQNTFIAAATTNSPIRSKIDKADYIISNFDPENSNAMVVGDTIFKNNFAVKYIIDDMSDDAVKSTWKDQRDKLENNDFAENLDRNHYMTGFRYLTKEMKSRDFISQKTANMEIFKANHNVYSPNEIVMKQQEHARQKHKSAQCTKKMGAVCL